MSVKEVNILYAASLKITSYKNSINCLKAPEYVARFISQ